MQGQLAMDKTRRMDMPGERLRGNALPCRADLRQCCEVVRDAQAREQVAVEQTAEFSGVRGDGGYACDLAAIILARHMTQDFDYAALADRLHTVQSALDAATRRSGRQTGDVRLIAVSKTHPADVIRTAAGFGQLEFGESRVQEALPKIETLAPLGLIWHFIGHLQVNKAKFIPGKFAWLHSLDSVELAVRMEDLLTRHDTTLNALIEVNLTGDPRRHGVAPDALMAFLESLSNLKTRRLHLRGLMGMAPWPASEADQRTAFARLRGLRDDCVQRSGLADFTELSMGMSDDYIPAILEGATMVRVGTGIFGHRAHM
jgi:pyridoxal phosphate enzyme (YggS family)